jgi:molybdopterin-containing oxidoreductase family iron-sulfur binding subunit
MDRRTFLKIAGLGSLSIAAGCSPEPEKNLFSLVQTPDDMVTGRAAWYASTCRECPAGCGILAKAREGRVIKVEGNPLHPINLGKLCMRGQAALQGLYNPDRIRTPLLKDEGSWRALSFSQAEDLLRRRIGRASGRGPDRIRVLSEVIGDSLLRLFHLALETWNAGGPLLFEPYAYESLKTANRMTFGIEGLASYRLEEADLLIGFGADFLETWLSPVAYARKFKEMHAHAGGGTGLFFHAGPYQSMTGANADLWVLCRPGGEAALALGLVREAIQRGRGRALPGNVRSAVAQVAAPYTEAKALEMSGADRERYRRLTKGLFAARRPLALGSGAGGTGGHALQTDVAANLLNLVMDPRLSLVDLGTRHRVEQAAPRSRVLDFFRALGEDAPELLLLNNVNPAYALPPGSGVEAALDRKEIFKVAFSNFMDETAQKADLVLPVALPLETWDDYSGMSGIVSTLQPAMASRFGAPGLGDLLLRLMPPDKRPAQDFRCCVRTHLMDEKRVETEREWLEAIQYGGIFEAPPAPSVPASLTNAFRAAFESPPAPSGAGTRFMAAPSIRFFDGRGANRPWLCEVPDPITLVAWQTPLLVHPETLAQNGLREGDVIRIQSLGRRLEAPVYGTTGVRPGILLMGIGQGHTAFGRYAEGMGQNPFHLLPHATDPATGGPSFGTGPVTLEKTGRSLKLARTDGSPVQHGRKIAVSVAQKDLDAHGAPAEAHGGGGYSMDAFPLVLPIPDGYDRRRDMYPPHEHEEYRWAMVIDLDKCIGCGACAAACYAENNIGLVGLERMLEGREMSWLMVQRYLDPQSPDRITFLPMLCQHCDNAPCESVCPVYAPHHSKEGLNNQIYNRCIGTRFCSQNCPYKVRRFNWFTWPWPEPLQEQLNPDVTVRAKGVMEKCSFCIQRIKEAHGIAKNENRKIRDGEIRPACLQTCPTGAFTFGNIMDERSRVRQMVEDPRAYQVMGYLNTKPAVIYLKKVLREI